MKKVFLLYLGISCVSHAALKKPLLIAHRQNTIPVLEQSLQLGVGGVEFDVQLCKTGEVVVIHPQLSDQLLHAVPVASKTYSELLQLDVGNGAHIPTLEHVLSCINRRAIAFIELKADALAAPVARVIEQYVTCNGWAYADFVIFPSRYTELKEIKRRLPQLTIAAIYEPWSQALNDWAAACAFSEAIVMRCRYVYPALVDQIHAYGKQIFAGEADDQFAAYAQCALGLDGVLSNNPAQAITAFTA